MAVARRSGPTERRTVNSRAKVQFHSTIRSHRACARSDGLYCISCQIIRVSRYDSIACRTMAVQFTFRGRGLCARQQINVVETEVETSGRPPMNHLGPGRPHRGGPHLSQTILSASRWPGWIVRDLPPSPTAPTQQLGQTYTPSDHKTDLPVK